MTTYILHGGYYKRNTPDNKNFFKAITDRLTNDSQILFVAYARNKSEWHKRKDEATKIFSDIIPDKKINLILASEDKDKFIDQLKLSDAIFITGGDGLDSLCGYLKKINNINELWENKIVVGSSAGALILSKYYCPWKKENIFEGLGILPIKTLTHWSEDQIHKFEKLKKYKEDLKIYKIPEEKFFIIEQ